MSGTTRHLGHTAPIPIRVYRPAQQTGVLPLWEQPALVWLHGGAFMAGDLDLPEADTVSRELGHRAGAVVVSVDCRLAVGAVVYPVPHDDATAAYRWVVTNA